MIKNNFFFLLIAFLFFTNGSFASPKKWNIVNNLSSINFTATQNGSPVNGKFTSFGGNIVFDPTDLSSSNVDIVIDMNSVVATYSNVSTTLKGNQWFNIKFFPKATYKAEKFTKTGENKYQADGVLTIKSQSMRTILKFKLVEFTDKKAVVEGYTTIKRNQFGVGQGEWSKTDSVKDEVSIRFTIIANRI